MQQNISSTLKILLAQFNGKILIPFAFASEIAGIPEQTARNQKSNGTYPIKTVPRGSRIFIHIEDLANYIESLRGESSKPKRGRPTKASRFQEKSEGGMQ